jgi:hypothetical protein
LGCGMCMFKYSIVQLNVFLSHVFWHVHQTCDITLLINSTSSPEPIGYS